jgi:predicted TIM-barrel fold metal-dependent hydrolase
MILDHFGTPLGVGVYADRKADIYAKWKDDIAAIAELPNVHAKLGGLAMPDNGFGYLERDKPPSSDELLDDQASFYEYTLGLFGADRCMFESNFPVDRVSVGYRVYWNAMKKLVAGRSEDDKEALFSGTARRVYGV